MRRQRLQIITGEDPVYPAVQTALAYGLISDGELFRPNDPISWSECIVMCCNAAGYGPKAAVLGGYPSGYYMAAAEMKLEIGQEQDSVSAADFYRLLLSTLEAEPLEQVGFGETVRYASRSGMTLLERQHGILKDEGIVNANRITAFGTDAERTTTDTIQIDGQVYQADEKWDAFLGYFGQRIL